MKKVSFLVVFLGLFFVVEKVGAVAPMASSICSWCGNSCQPSSMGRVCLDVAPPEGKRCVNQGTGCEIVDAEAKTVTPVITCTPRPACLDATPACKMPELDSYCPKVTITPTVTCTPRPACLDATPACKIPILESYCPKVVVSGDANKDGNVDLVDFNIWRGEYLKTSTSNMADFDGSGSIDLSDFNIWKNIYLNKVK